MRTKPVSVAFGCAMYLFTIQDLGMRGQILDAFVYAGYLAGITRRITLGTAGTVLPSRDPVVVAKQAMSVDQLTAGRFVPGLSSGDRPSEYPAFGVDFESRGRCYREGFQLIRQLNEQWFPAMDGDHFGRLDGRLDMVSRPASGWMPIEAIGRARQSIKWLAPNVDAWIWSVDDPQAASCKLQAASRKP